MTKSPQELLALHFGGASVAENLKRAVETGVVTEDADGFLTPTKAPPEGNWARVPYGPPLECSFLIRFLYPAAYARSKVPHGCHACYKVKVVPRTLRELVAAWGVGKRVACASKWGIDLDNPYSQNVYAGYFYTLGLDAARGVFRTARELIDQDPKLGPNVAMSIKRGCSEYETDLGPSDKYEFAPEQEELEAFLKTRFRDRQQQKDIPPLPLAYWIDVAFRIGDDTYLDFTHGQRLRPKTVTYDPGGN